MGSNLRKPSFYDTDYLRWTHEQADLLRHGRFADVDLVTVVEEIVTLGRSEQRELEPAYRVIAARKRDDVFDKAYRQARKEATSETGLPLAMFPDAPPFSRVEAEDDGSLPGGGTLPEDAAAD